MKKSQAIALSIGAAALTARWAIRRRRLIDLEGRSVVITGGSRGLGLVLARHFAAEGASVTLLARDPGELGRAQSELSNAGARVLAVPCDVTDERQIREALSKVVDRFGRIDVLVNNAGVIQVGPIEHMWIKDFEQAMQIHAYAALYSMLAAIPHMKAIGGGRIVNVASFGGEVAVAHMVPYCASKFALVGLSEAMRAELVKDKIYVTTACPWLMRTGSHIHAKFKGKHEREYAWFAAFAGMPLVSLDADRAAGKIVQACRYGDPHPTIGVIGRGIAIANALFPAMVSGGMAMMNTLLPAPDTTSPERDTLRTGRESRGATSPILTRLNDRAAERNNEI